MDMETQAKAMPFSRTEDAWYWCAAIISAQANGDTKRDAAGIERPCSPNEIYHILERLLRARTVTLDHVRVLARYGKLGREPDRRDRDERKDALPYIAAMAELDRALRITGVVAAP